LTVDEDALPGGHWGVKDVMATIHDHTILVQLLNRFNRCQTVWLVPVVLFEESSADVSEWSRERVSELENGGVILTKLRVGKTFVYFTSVHLL
jgi:hypothetical protein